MTRLRIMGVAAVTLAAALATGGPAAAAPAATARPPTALAAASCVVPPNSMSCNSPAIAAGPDRTIAFTATTTGGFAGCTVNVRDMTVNPTQQISSRGVTSDFTGWITGVTNTYRVELRRCAPGSTATIW